MRGRLAVLSVVSLLLMVAAVAPAQEATAALGERFSGPFDVSFKPFAAAKALEPTKAGDIARFIQEDKKWLMVFSRTDLPNPLPLKDSTTTDGKTQVGYLRTAINKLRSNDGTAEVLREDVIDLGSLGVGIIVAARQEVGKPVLLQQAIIEVTPRNYYTLTMTNAIETGDAAASPAAREAATVFKAIIESIEPVDLSQMKADQDDRLIRTRGLFAQWNRKKLERTLVGERYLRFKRDGKDIGYAYIVEQIADSLPKAGEGAVPPNGLEAATGLRLGIRTHTLADAGKTLDVENWMFVTFDRRHEVWTNTTVVKDPAAKTEKTRSMWFSEVGASDMQRERVFDRNLNHDDFKDADQRAKAGDNNAMPFREVDKYRLTVRNEGRSAVAEPIRRDLPPFYLPQALTTLLPRLVPLDNATGYLFAGYNSDNRQVMLRYIDVATERDVKIDGQIRRAIGISERVGYGGSVTTHYVTHKGEYLGSTNPDTGVEILPTDRATLESLWKTVELRVPDIGKE